MRKPESDSAGSGQRQQSTVWVFTMVMVIMSAVALCLRPLPAPAAAASASVRETIAQWQHAWQEKDFETYAGFYSTAFFASVEDRLAWRQRKSTLFAAPGAIRVDITGLSVMAENDRATATFIQHYHSPRLTDVGRKTLQWRLEADRWRIIREHWQPVPEAAGPDPVAEAPDDAGMMVHTRQDAMAQLQPFALAMLTGDRSEHMCIRLDRHFVPRVDTISPGSERISVVIEDVPQWKGPDQVFDGRWVHQISAVYNASRRSLRVTVDLEPGSNCRISPVYIESANIFCLDLIEE